MTDIARLLDALEAAGCEPRELGPGQWIAWCPSCKLAGRKSRLEIRTSGAACCESAHGLYAADRTTSEAKAAA